MEFRIDGYGELNSMLYLDFGPRLLSQNWSFIAF